MFALYVILDLTVGNLRRPQKEKVEQSGGNNTTKTKNK
jgi:hypothetical protein